MSLPLRLGTKSFYLQLIFQQFSYVYIEIIIKHKIKCHHVEKLGEGYTGTFCSIFT
jgi:hypothetical protein